MKNIKNRPIQCFRSRFHSIPYTLLAGLTGFLWLGQQPMLIAIIMLFASGVILYSVFQDIAPQAKLEKHWAPAMGAVIGFMCGLVGSMLTLTA